MPSRKPSPKGGRDVLTIKQTAALLGVSEVTLRRWDKCGKFSPHRHPLNGYRCYQREEVLRLRREIRIGEDCLTSEERPAAQAAEPHDATERMLARDARLRARMAFALRASGSTASGAVIAACAAEIEDDDDVAAVRMLQDAMTAFVNKSPRETRAARSWHALRDGFDPDQDAIAIVDLARQAARTVQMFRLSGTQVHTGVAAIEALRADLVGHFGESVPTVAKLKEWFAKVDQPTARGGLAITGLVTHIIHEGRLLGARGGTLAKTRKRVSRVLKRHPSPRELSIQLPIPPTV